MHGVHPALDSRAADLDQRQVERVEDQSATPQVDGSGGLHAGTGATFDWKVWRQTFVAQNSTEAEINAFTDATPLLRYYRYFHHEAHRGQYNRLEVPHMLLDDVRVGDVVELNTPTAGQTFHVFVYEIAEDEVRYRYGLMGASVGQCLMSNIVRVVGPD